MTQLIGLYSPAPQSGKTFTASVLEQSGYKAMSFAEPIKKMATEFIMSFGYPKEEAVRFVWASKEEMIPAIKTHTTFFQKSNSRSLRFHHSHESTLFYDQTVLQTANLPLNLRKWPAMKK